MASLNLHPASERGIIAVAKNSVQFSTVPILMDRFITNTYGAPHCERFTAIMITVKCDGDPQLDH